MSTKFVPLSDDTIPITVLNSDKLESWLADQPENIRHWVMANGFTAALGKTLLLADGEGGISGVLLGKGSLAERARGRFQLAAAAETLPEGSYRLLGLTKPEAEEAALGWLLAAYRFERYKSAPKAKPGLVAPQEVDANLLETIAAGEFLTRDLINTPASDMGPRALENAFTTLGREFGAKTTVIKGKALLKSNLPLIHAVGRAAAQKPRLLDLRWGDAAHPKLTLVGKGVCFDTGGLNLKPGASMGLMKKDLGGAASVLGLARIIMALGLPLRLRVLVPAVENSVSAGAFRPGDILTSRKGLTVEINNTDAEGRLVLADALALADEESPELLISMATLTGAARVALGADLVPYYTDDDALSDALGRASREVKDPLWRMPFWEPYEAKIEPGIADLDNAPSGGFAGSITAALFLRRFVQNAGAFVHFDLYGWNNAAKPARPKGAAFQAARAVFEMLEQKKGKL
jgi:leucyl aminopeptidase